MLIYSNVLNGAGNSVVSYQYDDFGETQIKGNTEFYNQVCYTGAIYDASTGLYYMNARYYDPEDGRFITQDTYRGEQTHYGTWHLYTYCANNLIKYVDPSEHWFGSVKKWAKSKAKSVYRSVKRTAKKAVRVTKKVWKNKNVRIIMIGMAVIGACAVATVLTGGACAGVAGAIVAGALKGAIAGAAWGAATGAAGGAIRHRRKYKTWKGAGRTAWRGAVKGYMHGAISGTITGPKCFVAGTKVLAEN